MAKSGAETTIIFWSSIFAGIIDFPRFGRKTEPTINDWVLSVLIPKRQKSIIDLLRGNCCFFGMVSWWSMLGKNDAVRCTRRALVNDAVKCTRRAFVNEGIPPGLFKGSWVQTPPPLKTWWIKLLLNATGRRCGVITGGIKDVSLYQCTTMPRVGL